MRYAKGALPNLKEDAVAEDRARSFIERYVIARAATFRAGVHEVEDMHACTLLAKSAYRHIADVARSAEPDPFDVWQAGPSNPSTRFPVVETVVSASHGSQSDSQALNNLSPATWVEAGKGCILTALNMFMQTGTKPPESLIAAKEIIYGTKK